MKLYIWAISFCSMLMGCREMRADEAVHHMRNLFPTKTAETRELSIEVRLLPRHYSAVSMVQDSLIPISKSLLDSIESSTGLGNGIQFLMTISSRNNVEGLGLETDLIYGKIGGFSNYGEATNAYQFGIQDKIWLETGGKKFPLARSHMINSYGIDHGRDFVLVFPDIGSPALPRIMEFNMVLDNLVPGLGRKKLDWVVSKRKYEFPI